MGTVVSDPTRPEYQSAARVPVLCKKITCRPDIRCKTIVILPPCCVSYKNSSYDNMARAHIKIR